MSSLFVSTTVNCAPITITCPTYVIVYLPEDLLRRYYQAHNLPYGHLKVHLRKLEHALEEARHLDLIPPR
jgi:hypothetical protein